MDSSGVRDSRHVSVFGNVHAVARSRNRGGRSRGMIGEGKGGTPGL